MCMCIDFSPAMSTVSPLCTRWHMWWPQQMHHKRNNKFETLRIRNYELCKRLCVFISISILYNFKLAIKSNSGNIMRWRYFDTRDLWIAYIWRFRNRQRFTIIVEPMLQNIHPIRFRIAATLWLSTIWNCRRRSQPNTRAAHDGPFHKFHTCEQIKFNFFIFQILVSNALIFSCCAACFQLLQVISLVQQSQRPTSNFILRLWQMNAYAQCV